MKNKNNSSNIIKQLNTFSTKLVLLILALFIYSGNLNAHTDTLPKSIEIENENNNVENSNPKRLIGTWIIYRPDGSVDRSYKAKIFVINGSPVFSIAGDRVYFQLKGNKLTANKVNLYMKGTVNSTYTKIYWADKSVWVKEGGSSGSNANRRTSTSKSVKSINGNWTGYNSNGTKSAYVWQIRQSGRVIYMKNIGTNQKLESRGVITENRIAADSFDASGTISSNGTRISWTNGTYWIKQSPTRSSSSTSNRNRSSSNNRNSGSNRSVKNIAGNWTGYDTRGRKSAYIWKIVQSGGGVFIKNIGTSQKLESRGSVRGNQISTVEFKVSGTLSADGNKISWANGTYWVRNSSIRSSNRNNTSKPPASRIKNVTGNWAGYFKDGRKSAYVWKISQNGSTLSIKEIGTSQNLVSRGRISGDQVFATDFKTKGKLSADGRAIYWSDGVIWRKQ